MTEIINGKLVYNELTKNANGGTELMARRMVEYLPSESLEGYQIIHSRVRELEPDLKRILICHDLPNDPEVQQLSDPEFRKNFEKIVFVSNWQQHMYNMVLGVPFSESYVIPNGIIPDKEYSPRETTGPIRLIYHTTPHRGLNLLIPAFEELSKHFDVHLDVFSSFNAYGWGERDKEFQEIFDRIDSLPNVTNHGFQSNDVVRDYLRKADIFAYPCIWTETSCLAMIEAMCAGCVVLHSNLGALPETSLGQTRQYMLDEDPNRHVNNFYIELFSIVNQLSKKRNDPNIVDFQKGCMHKAKLVYDFNGNIKNNWEYLFRRLRNDKSL